MVFKSNTEIANILQENIYNTKGLNLNEVGGKPRYCDSAIPFFDN